MRHRLLRPVLTPACASHHFCGSGFLCVRWSSWSLAAGTGAYTTCFAALSVKMLKARLNQEVYRRATHSKRDAIRHVKIPDYLPKCNHCDALFCGWKHKVLHENSVHGCTVKLTKTVTTKLTKLVAEDSWVFISRARNVQLPYVCVYCHIKIRSTGDIRNLERGASYFQSHWLVSLHKSDEQSAIIQSSRNLFVGMDFFQRGSTLLPQEFKKPIKERERDILDKLEEVEVESELSVSVTKYPHPVKYKKKMSSMCRKHDMLACEDKHDINEGNGVDESKEIKEENLKSVDEIEEVNVCNETNLVIEETPYAFQSVHSLTKFSASSKKKYAKSNAEGECTSTEKTVLGSVGCLLSASWSRAKTLASSSTTVFHFGKDSSEHQQKKIKLCHQNCEGCRECRKWQRPFRRLYDIKPRSPLGRMQNQKYQK